MIYEDFLTINAHSSNYKYYTNLGYVIQVRKPFIVKVKDLMRGSNVIITSICCNCNGHSKNPYKDYFISTNGLTEEFYCKHCNYIKSEKTCLVKYNVKNPMQDEDIKSNYNKSIIEKYGVKHYSQTDEYKEKFKKTCIIRYNVDNPFKSEEIKQNIRNKNINNLDVEYPMQSPEVQQKSKDTCKLKYGVEHYSQTDECKKQILITTNLNYGVNNISQSLVIREAINKTHTDRYGMHYTQTDLSKEIVKNTRQRMTFKKFSDLLETEYVINTYNDEILNIKHIYCDTVFDISKSLTVARYRLNNIICTKCNPIGVQHSSIEYEVGKFINDLGIKYISGDRKLLKGQELDIFIPEKLLAIEINGLYWHSEFFKKKTYHIEKTLACLSNNINLIHVWEDDWRYKKDIVKSIIMNRLGLISNKIWARKCIIKNVKACDARNFLDNNHIQGFCSSTHKIGLYYNNELVSLMTFGFRHTNSKKEFELVRFCNKINTSVIGSASKLFKYFIHNNIVSEIISYADISMFSGELYNTLNFKKVSLSVPNYYWVVDNKKRHRYNYTKNKLISQGFDKNKTEVEIMQERGYYRIFSCGQEKWLFLK